MKLEDIGMQANNMLKLARETRKKVRQSFGSRVETITVYDVVDVPNHHMFKLNFAAYDYFWIQFNYENGLCGFSLIFNDQFGTSLGKRLAYSEITDWDSYLKDVMEEIELRIPDKFLKAKGWL